MLVLVRRMTRALPPCSVRILESAIPCLNRNRVRSIAALLTAALHVIILSPLILGVGPRGSLHSLTGNAVANAQNADEAEFASTLVYVTDHRTDAPKTLSIPKVQELNPLIDLKEMAEVPQLVISVEEDSEETGAAIGSAERAITFVRYMGQITSRIERSWILPSKMLATDFHCRVQILRDEVGTVKEVTLQNCDTDSAVRLSVVQAIQKASPLPVLPGDSVFSGIITLDFHAEAGLTRASSTSVQPGADDS